MSRINAVNVETANGKAGELFKAIKTQMGGVPNIFSTMAQSPVILEAFLRAGLRSL